MAELTPIGGHLRLIVDRTAEIKAAADKRELKLFSIFAEAAQNFALQNDALKRADKLRYHRLVKAQVSLFDELIEMGLTRDEISDRMRKALGEAHG